MQAGDGPGGQPPTIYRWVDADGVAHYTAHRDRVPSAVRGSLQEIQPTAPPPSDAPLANTPPPVPAAASSPDSSWAVQDAGPPPVPAPGQPGSRLAARASNASADTSGLDARIAGLEAEIARDEDALKDFLSAAPSEGDAALPSTPAFREIARRLPKLQADLRSLREQRARAGGASASDAPLGSGSARDDF